MRDRIRPSVLPDTRWWAGDRAGSGAGRIAAYNADPDGRDWGVPVLYLRAVDSRLFEGAPDAAVRQQARAAADADVSVLVREVAAGGRVLSVEVIEMTNGKLAVSVHVGVVSGEVIGARIKRLEGVEAKIETDANKVEPGGSLTGATMTSCSDRPQ